METDADPTAAGDGSFSQHTSQSLLTTGNSFKPIPPGGHQAKQRSNRFKGYTDDQDINANHRGNTSSLATTGNASYFNIVPTGHQGWKQHGNRRGNGNYVATRISSGNYVQYEDNSSPSRPIPAARSNYAIQPSTEKTGQGVHVGRSGSVPVGISKLLTSPPSVAKQQQHIASHSSVQVSRGSHSIASVAGIDPYSNQPNYSLSSITQSSQYIGGSNSVLATAPSNHSLTTIAHASEYTGYPAPNVDLGIPFASSKLSSATSSGKSQAELRNSSSTPGAPPVPPKPKRHSDGLDHGKKAANGIPHSQSYSEAMLRRSAASPGQSKSSVVVVESVLLFRLSEELHDRLMIGWFACRPGVAAGLPPAAATRGSVGASVERNQPHRTRERRCVQATSKKNTGLNLFIMGSWVIRIRCASYPVVALQMSWSSIRRRRLQTWRRTT